MKKKICSKCKEEKNICDFNTRKNRKGVVTLRGYCKNCHSKISYKFNVLNPEKHKEYRIKWYTKNSKKLIQKNKERRNSDLLYSLKINVRTRLKLALKHNFKKGKTVELLGISILQFKEYLESKFTHGMSWDTYGPTGWHIDHIVPLFSAKNQDDFIKLCHYTNLQPLWSSENFKKGKNILP